MPKSREGIFMLLACAWCLLAELLQCSGTYYVPSMSLVTLIGCYNQLGDDQAH